MTIWKFRLDPSGQLEMPCTHRILSVGAQGEDMVMWALVDPTTKLVPKLVTIVGSGWTGWHMDGVSQKRFVGTVQMPGGLVFHVFE